LFRLCEVGSPLLLVVPPLEVVGGVGTTGEVLKAILLYASVARWCLRQRVLCGT